MGTRGNGRGASKGMSSALGNNRPQGYLPVLEGKHDRYCVHCGFVVSQQNLRKIEKCSLCDHGLPGRKGWSKDTGMGRCSGCDSFMHVAFAYCQFCGLRNEEFFRRQAALERKRNAEIIEEKDKQIADLKRKMAEMERIQKQVLAKTAGTCGEPESKKTKSDDVDDDENDEFQKAIGEILEDLGSEADPPVEKA